MHGVGSSTTEWLTRSRNGDGGIPLAHKAVTTNTFKCRDGHIVCLQSAMQGADKCYMRVQCVMYVWKIYMRNKICRNNTVHYIPGN